MSRFADLIRDDGVNVTASFANPSTNRYEAQYIEEQMSAAPIVFDVTAVAQAVADGMPIPSTPPAMRPPLDLLWAEYAVPDRVDGLERVGALVHTMPWDERSKRPALNRPEYVSYKVRPEDDAWVAQMQARLAGEGRRFTSRKEADRGLRRLNRLHNEHVAAMERAHTMADDLQAELDAHEEDVAAMSRLEGALTVEPTWFVVMHGYARVNGENVTGFGRWHWALDERGDPLAASHVREAHTARFMTVALAMSLTNCGNVDQDTHHPSGKIQRARERRGKPPLFSYRTLVIRPMARTGGADPVDRSDAATRLHLRRGGFRDYRANGLFGREYLRRVFWFSPTLVGREEHGRVDKDYAVAGQGAS